MHFLLRQHDRPPPRVQRFSLFIGKIQIDHYLPLVPIHDSQRLGITTFQLSYPGDSLLIIGIADEVVTAQTFQSDDTSIRQYIGYSRNYTDINRILIPFGIPQRIMRATFVTSDGLCMETAIIYIGILLPTRIAHTKRAHSRNGSIVR